MVYFTESTITHDQFYSNYNRLWSALPKLYQPVVPFIATMIAIGYYSCESFILVHFTHIIIVYGPFIPNYNGTKLATLLIVRASSKHVVTVIVLRSGNASAFLCRCYLLRRDYFIWRMFRPQLKICVIPINYLFSEQWNNLRELSATRLATAARISGSRTRGVSQPYILLSVQFSVLRFLHSSPWK